NEPPTGNGNGGNGSQGDSVNQTAAFALSYDYKDYIGDLETFVYGLITSKLEYIYDVFTAYVELSDSYCVYGLGYTDYTECYTNEEETSVCFMAGFLPFVGELEIPEEEFNAGLYLYDLDYQDEETQFVWAYKSDAFLEHCVVYGTYLQYGVSEDGQIVYNAAPYEKEKCDLSLGSLYSYDASRYLVDFDLGEYLPITGLSVFESFDYQEFEREVNAVIEEQNANWMTCDIETVAYTSQEAVKAYLLSLQEETFFGYSVDQLVQLTEELNPLECFRVTPEGLEVVNIEEPPEEEPSALVKWMVGSACAIVAAVGTVASIITSVCPPLSSLAGSVTGAAIETFMQVVVESKTLDNVSWQKVGIAAASGALSGFIGPYLQALNGAKYFFIDSAIDGIIGATEQAVFAWMDGARGKELLTKFGYGFALGAGISAGFKVAGKVVSKIGQAVSDGVQKIAKKLSPKLTATLTAFTKPVRDLGNAIGDTIHKLKKKADSSLFHSEYILERQAFKQVGNIRISYEDSNIIEEKSYKSLAKEDIYVNDNRISKSQLKASFDNAEDKAIIGKYKKQYNGTIEEIDIIKCNNAYSVRFDKKYSTAVIKEGLTGNRNSNYLRAAEELLTGEWLQNPARIPSEIKEEMLKRYPGRTIEDILEFVEVKKLSKEVVDIVTDVEISPYVFHENIDLVSVSLVPRELHDKTVGGVGHMGAISLIKYLKEKYGVEYLEEFIKAATKGIQAA
ncbi:MAG: hypothetical protein IJF71_05655, partial [Clostridia bacterium]|nr:hypothetical protein [Clostridia bacterium]